MVPPGRVAPVPWVAQDVVEISRAIHNEVGESAADKFWLNACRRLPELTLLHSGVAQHGRLAAARLRTSGRLGNS